MIQKRSLNRMVDLKRLILLLAIVVLFGCGSSKGEKVLSSHCGDYDRTEYLVSWGQATTIIYFGDGATYYIGTRMNVPVSKGTSICVEHYQNGWGVYKTTGYRIVTEGGIQ